MFQVLFENQNYKFKIIAYEVSAQIWVKNVNIDITL